MAAYTQIVNVNADMPYMLLNFVTSQIPIEDHETFISGCNGMISANDALGLIHRFLDKSEYIFDNASSEGIFLNQIHFIAINRFHFYIRRLECTEDVEGFFQSLAMWTNNMTAGLGVTNTSRDAASFVVGKLTGSTKTRADLRLRVLVAFFNLLVEFDSKFIVLKGKFCCLCDPCIII